MVHSRSTLQAFWAVLLTLGTCTVSLAAQELEPVPEPQENPVTEAKRVLGKILFWDEQLSSDNTVACGTCHQAQAGGSDPRQARHPGVDDIFNSDDDVIGSPGIALRDANNQPVSSDTFGMGAQVTNRATPSFIMAMYADSLFWDGRAESSFVNPLNSNDTVISSGGALESQSLGPILSSIEMAHEDRDWTDVTEKLSRVTPLRLATDIPDDMAAALETAPSYGDLFTSAFGESAITPARIAMALATYERTLVADQTPWDLYMAGDDSAMTPDQLNGWLAYEQETDCVHCHVPPLFTDNQFHNIGLRPAEEDIGREGVTGNAADTGHMRTASLRNASLRPGLMHVGWISDVGDAVDFYLERGGHNQFTEDQSRIPDGSRNGRPYENTRFAGGDTQVRAEIIEFIETGLLDPRVEAGSFPFDQPTLSTERDAPLKVMSYNVTSTGWTNARAEAVADIIAFNTPSIVALQEAGSTQKADLEAALGNDYDLLAFGADNSHPILLEEGAFTILDSGEVNTGTSCLSERFINYAVLEVRGSTDRFILLNSHFCHDGDFDGSALTGAARRELHAAALTDVMDTLEDTWGLPFVVAGDLNAAAGSTVMEYLLEGGELSGGSTHEQLLADSWDTTYPGATRTSAVDWILHSPFNLTVVENLTLSSNATAAASDHNPVLASIIVETTPENTAPETPDEPTDVPADDGTNDGGTGGDTGGDAGGGNTGGDNGGDPATEPDTGTTPTPVQTPTTSSAGGGCMVSPEGGNDPVLAMLILLTMLLMLRNKTATKPAELHTRRMVLA